MFAFTHALTRLSKVRVAPYLGVRRTLVSVPSLRSPSETVSVPCMSNGNITLEIYYPEAKQQSQGRGSSVGIFLPRGPILTDPADDACNLTTLCTTLRCTVVKINYRCDEKFRFPTPIHDVITGYDWVQQNLLPRRSIVRAGRAERIGTIATCGELLGGQLSTMLALTECRVGEPGVVAAAVGNPIVDWVSLDQARASQDNLKVSQLSVTELLHKRDEIFRRPADYFDPFASPIHFFRTAGVDVPRPIVERPLGDMSELMLSERDDLYGKDTGFEQISGKRADSSEQDAAGNGSRKASLRYPSKAFGLYLPDFYIAAGQKSPIFGHVKEFTRRLQKSLVRQRHQHVDGVKVDIDGSVDDDKNPPILHPSPDLGLWDQSERGHERMLNVARWLDSKL